MKDRPNSWHIIYAGVATVTVALLIAWAALVAGLREQRHLPATNSRVARQLKMIRFAVKEYSTRHNNSHVSAFDSRSLPGWAAEVHSLEALFPLERAVGEVVLYYPTPNRMTELKSEKWSYVVPANLIGRDWSQIDRDQAIVVTNAPPEIRYTGITIDGVLLQR